ncbi:hypothetical protein ACFXJ6_25805 [Streptomyces sp. NPDC059218]|uniref:hypothetical protein n=1 Tax=unclassified Streptomyces TaxID=2593676 RepID=UPI0036AC7D74
MQITHLDGLGPVSAVIRIISFGCLHLPTDPTGRPIPPAADRVEDVRDRLRDPAAARDILDLDGVHPRVQDVVLNTPGARELIDQDRLGSIELGGLQPLGRSCQPRD